MAEQEKAMTVTVENAGDDASPYQEDVRLRLPAEPGEIQGVMDRAVSAPGSHTRSRNASSAGGTSLPSLRRIHGRTS